MWELQVHSGDIDWRAVPFHHDNSAVGDVVELLVALQIEADRCVWRDADVLIQNGPANPGAAANIAIVENNGVFDGCMRVNSHPTPDDGGSNQTARQDRSARNDGIQSFPTPAVAIENEFRRGVEISSGAERPRAVVQI